MYKRPSYLLRAITAVLAAADSAAALTDPNKQPITARFFRQTRIDYLRSRSRYNGRGGAFVRPNPSMPEIECEIVQAAIDKRARRGLRLCAEGR